MKDNNIEIGSFYSINLKESNNLFYFSGRIGIKEILEKNK